MFTGLLAYKLEEQGKRLVKIDKWFHSQKLAATAARSRKTCYCHNGHIAVIAAINIKNEGIRLLA